jgi:23S rRNA pseudouridine1911/1915/1917 synthase
MPDRIVGDLFVASATGKKSRSVVRVVERRAQTTLLDVAIETGRPHQIRIHAAVIGHPLVGEPVYGAGGIRHHDSTARPGDIGYQLHAHTLQLRHPRSGARLVLVAPPPSLLASLPETA